MLYGDEIHDDTQALQAVLDGCGVVTVDKPVWEGKRRSILPLCSREYV